MLFGENVDRAKTPAESEKCIKNGGEIRQIGQRL